MSTRPPLRCPLAIGRRWKPCPQGRPCSSSSAVPTPARFLLDPDVTNAGRSPKADIFLDDVTVSRKHCQFIASNGGHIVRDSGSLNGTYVNRERVDSIELHAGDEVQIGKYRLTYQPSTKRA